MELPELNHGETVKAKGLRLFIIGLCVALVSACAAQKVQSRLWSAYSITSAGGGSDRGSSEHVTLTLPNHVIAGSVNRDIVHGLLKTSADIDEAALMQTNLYITDRGQPHPNAFAGYVQDGYIVAININMIDMLATNPSMYAALLAHEIAHNVKKHHEATENRRAVLQVGGAAVGVALGVISGPIAGGLTSVTASLIDYRFSREQEMEADALGVQLMHQAGYPLDGAILFYEKLSESSEQGLSFLSSHPGGEERIAHVKEVIESLREG